MTKDNWEIELRSKLWDLWFIDELKDWSQVGSCGGYCLWKNKEEADKFFSDLERLKEFLSGKGTSHNEKWEKNFKTISNFLLQQKQETVKMIEKRIRNDFRDDGFCNFCNGHKDNPFHKEYCGIYNQALNDILEKLK